MKRLALACVVLGLAALTACQKEAPQKGPAPAKPQAYSFTPATTPGSGAGESTGVVPAKPPEDRPASANLDLRKIRQGPRAGRDGARSSPGPRAGDAPAGNAGAGQHTEEIQAVVEKKLPDDSKPDEGKKPPAKP